MDHVPPRGEQPPYFQLADPAVARERVLFPGIFLLVVAVLNIFVALFLASGGIIYHTLPVNRVERMLAERDAKQWDEMQRNGYTAQKIADLAVRLFFSG